MSNIDFSENPLIAAVRTDEELVDAINAPVGIIFLLKTDIFKIKADIQKIHEAGKLVFVHFDLMEGIGKDYYGVKFLKEVKADGMISTRQNLIRYAKELNLMNVERFFIVDSQSINNVLESVQTVKPDMIEVMPGVVTSVIKKLWSEIKIPIIAGGLIAEKSEIVAALNAGASAISTKKKELWYV